MKTINNASFLPKKTLYLWQIRLGVAALLISICVGLFGLLSAWMLLPASILFLLLLICVFWFLPLYLKSYRIEVSENAIIVKRGVFIKTTHLMPFPRLVYAKSYASPLAEVMGLAGVSLRAARGVIFIPELDKADAIYLIQGISGGERR